MQESDSFSAWLQWQCSVVVVIFKAGKNTSAFISVHGDPGVFEFCHVWNKLQHPQPEKGLLVVPPNASHGMGQGPGKLFIGCFIANKILKSQVLSALCGE